MPYHPPMKVPENLWYPVLQSREVRSRPVGVERLGRRLVFWRSSDGVLHTQDERCPHLGAALSKGRIAADRIVCPFHGFEYDGAGHCRLIPANGKDGRIPAGMQVRTYPVRELQGLVFLWWGPERDTYPELPFFEDLLSGWRMSTMAVDWPVHYTRAIENQLDVAHIPFVHKSTIGAGGREFVDGPYVVADDSSIRVWTTNSVDPERPSRSQAELAESAAGRPPILHLQLPGLWMLLISPTFRNLIAFVPINEQKTRYYLRAYHQVRNPLLARPFEFLLGLSNRFILNQDRRVVVTQRPLRSADAGHDRLIGADRAIAQYRRWHARALGSSAPALQPAREQAQKGQEESPVAFPGITEDVADIRSPLE